uniref:Transmembrane protease serine 9-like n=1 Tax=Sinocyclocheilus anshuiensis TaxID=1608454 RepID=A0A671SAU9_9TELE
SLYCIASLHRSGSHFCGGSLINNEWVLTASNPCNYKKKYLFNGCGECLTLVLPPYSSTSLTNANEVSRNVSQIIKHPAYNSITEDNDITLLHLSSPVTFTDHIRPVCLASANSTFFKSTVSWVTGWGNIRTGGKVLILLTLIIHNILYYCSTDCKCLYGVSTITDNMLCAGPLEGGKDSCQGDSGGPLVSKQGSVWVQSGVVSFGNGCALPNLPGVYARVSKYQNWINDLTGIE